MNQHRVRRRPVSAATACLLIAAALGCNLGQTAASQAPGQSSVSATAPVGLTATPLPLTTVQATFTDQDKTLTLDSGTVKVVVDKDWGGAIREIWFEGQNFINNYDGGRLLGAAFYDSAQGPASSKPNDTGWNPSPSDMHNHANRPLAYSFEDNTLYIKTRQSQWYPDDKGGGPGKLISTDVIAETWIAFVTDAQTIHLRYRLTHEGQDSHVLASQEFPFAYVRVPYKRFVSYTGSKPWTGDDVRLIDLPTTGSTSHLDVAPEQWAGFVDDSDTGLILWAPQNYDNFTYEYLKNAGPPENSTLYLLPRAFFAIGPGFTQETNAYLFVGKWQAARDHLYALHQGRTFPDIMPPMGNFGEHPGNETVKGVYPIEGWAIDNTRVTTVEVRIDGQTTGKAAYGNPRPDVDRDYPGQAGAPNFGFTYSLDTTAFPNGTHTLEIVAVDGSGNTSQLIPGPVTLTIAN